jgi:hypothetical protein
MSNTIEAPQSDSRFALGFGYRPMKSALRVWANKRQICCQGGV